MNGAEALLRTLAGAGVEVCFTNPGTSEMHLVAALDRVEEIRPILALFEGVASGAADGYARMAGKPASTLLHLGPGLANGLANFHNARKAHTPLVSLVGEHARQHEGLDAPLSADVEAFARTVSGWVRTARDPQQVGRDAAEALQAARTPPGQVATLVIPADVAWSDGAEPAAAPAPPKRDTVAPAQVRAAAAALRSGEPAVILMSGQALRERGLATAGRIARAVGARLFCDTFNARLARGAGRPFIPSLPYFAEGVLDVLKDVRHLVLVGTQAPVAFFAYPGKPSRLTPEGCAVHPLASPADDAEAALEALADELGASREALPLQERARPAAPVGTLDPAAIGASLAALLPEGAIVSDEAITGAAALLPATRGAAPHDWLGLTGGAIGQGLPLATGAAVACPDRPVVCLQADGSAMYTLQSLWTQAREGLDVTTVLLANRSYAILEIELARVGATPGPRARRALDIAPPALDFVALAQGMGVPALRVSTAEDFHARFAAALTEPGPHLIEAVLREVG